jgi:hypothetical protein
LAIQGSNLLDMDVESNHYKLYHLIESLLRACKLYRDLFSISPRRYLESSIYSANASPVAKVAWGPSWRKVQHSVVQYNPVRYRQISKRRILDTNFLFRPSSELPVHCANTPTISTIRRLTDYHAMMSNLVRHSTLFHTAHSHQRYIVRNDALYSQTGSESNGCPFASHAPERSSSRLHRLTPAIHLASFMAMIPPAYTTTTPTFEPQ